VWEQRGRKKNLPSNAGGGDKDLDIVLPRVVQSPVLSMARVSSTSEVRTAAMWT
jgi:hypothetical protein